MPATIAPRFRVVDAAMVRVAARPVGRHVGPAPPPADAEPEAWQHWARDLGADGDLMEAMELVSPSLAAQVRKVADGGRLRPRQYARTGAAVARYQSRMTRATPLGRFAAVGPVRFGAPSVPDPTAVRAVVRADAEWLDAVVVVLEQTPELLRRVRVVADQTAFVRGGRLVLPWARASGGGTSTAPGDEPPGPDREPAAEITVRCTAPVQLVRRLAATPVVLGTLVDAVAERYPGTGPERITRMLTELVSVGVLHTDLRAPMTVTDPLSHLVDRLTAYDARAIDGIADMVGRARPCPISGP